MRVLHVYKSYYPDTLGGVEQVIAQLGRGLADLGVENRIYTVSPAPEPAVLVRAEGEVHRSKSTGEIASNPFSLAALREFRAHVAWADVIHYQFPWPFGDLLHLLWGRARPSVVSYQAEIVRQKWLLRAYAPLMHRFLASVDAVVTTSPEFRASSPVLSRLEKPVRVIPNGSDAASFPQPSADCVQRWRAQVGAGFLLFVGVLRYYKGLHTLLDAAAGFGGRVVIAGTGPETERLRQQAQQQGLGNVVFLGRVSDEDKMALLQLATGFVFPSHLRAESFGMSLVEAAIAGKPMISSEIGTGTTYVNLDGVTGLTVPPEQPQALRQAMQWLVDHPQQAAEMGRAARHRFEQLFTAARMARSYHQIYCELTTGPRISQPLPKP